MAVHMNPQIWERWDPVSLGGVGARVIPKIN